MTAPKEKVWQISAHTKAKHAILKRYFEGWLPIVGSWAKTILYIDGFAGPGIYKDGEPGSPIIVLQSARNHRASILATVQFMFIEKDQERYHVLQDELKKLGSLPENFRVTPYQGAFKDLEKHIDRMNEEGKRLVPTFAFIDPFGFTGFPMRLVQKILGNQTCEVMITFMVRDLDRFCEVQDENVTDLFGCEDWKECRGIEDSSARRQMLIQVYGSQLKAGGAQFVLPFEMADQYGNTIYYLIFATNALKGMEVMKGAMVFVDKTMNYRFADLVPQEQKHLLQFGLEETWVDFACHNIWERFSGTVVRVEQVRNYVIGETIYPFRKSILKKLMSLDSPAVQYVDQPDKMMTFPDHIRILFEIYPS